MANVWVGENYYIKNVYLSDSVRYEVVPNANINVQQYLVNLQRLPESSYPLSTEVFLDSYIDGLAADISNEDLLAAVLSKVNTALSVDDASDKSDDHAPTALDIYTLKL
jgi:hypothetical protein